MRLLIIGDIDAHTGFARVVETVAAGLKRNGWDIGVLGVQYHGDPSPLQQHYRLYPALLGGDALGIGRIKEVLEREQPDAILAFSDPWIVAEYLRMLPNDAPPVIAHCPVDAMHLRQVQVKPLNRLTHFAAYTHFGLNEMRAAGYIGPASVIPLGVERDVFYPVERSVARETADLGNDLFLVLLLDRNHWRKRLDLAFAGFARFARDVPEARLVYHGALRDLGWDIGHLAEIFGVTDKLVLTGRRFTARAGVPMSALRTIYSMCDVRLSTSLGEGWGLPTMEAMACGLPCIVPGFAGLGEWAAEAAYVIPCDDLDDLDVYAGDYNTVGYRVKPSRVEEALEYLYHRPSERNSLREDGLRLVANPAYQWQAIIDQFDDLLFEAVSVRRNRSSAVGAPEKQNGRSALPRAQETATADTCVE